MGPFFLKKINLSSGHANIMGFIIFTHTCILVLSFYPHQLITALFGTHSYTVNTLTIERGRENSVSNVFLKRVSVQS